jgi:hypothetical protein
MSAVGKGVAVGWVAVGVRVGPIGVSTMSRKALTIGILKPNSVWAKAARAQDA